ncbi:type III secretion system chaperone [Acanthopleuribacter pedis]|uniref:Type III secretion system chaperone n=1 Tax=Acanthopleuribacter pedis TaxID=442870 RepID=A0A8J7U6E5_9BACT|nr:type III secretion system chaperone [Acanthopleuribacter pedis]MBO1322697.1 type III secretion system chaperone [Acanthopleuribacter pedis]
MDDQAMSREIVSGLSEAFGGPAAQFKSDDYAHLVYEHRSVLCFQYLAERKSVVVFVILGRVPEHVLAKVLEHGLFSNLFWQRTRGTTLAYDDARQALVLQQRIHLVGLNPADFQEKVTHMAEVAAMWTDLLNRAAQTTPAEATAPGSPAPLPAEAGTLNAAEPSSFQFDPSRFALTRQVLPKRRDKSEGFWLKIWSEMAWKSGPGSRATAPAGPEHFYRPLQPRGLAKITASALLRF